MGACASSKNKVSVNHILGPAELTYSRTISRRFMKAEEGKAPSQVPMTLALTEPYLSVSRKVAVDGREFWTSVCVLPGIDPHKTTPKQCQDMSFVESDGETLLCGVFDGHGPNGRDVAQFCCKTAVAFYKNNKQACTADPSAFLETLSAKLDNDMKLSTNGVDVSASGS